MPVLTLICCRMFEDEVVHLLEEDPLITDITVIENDESEGIQRKLEASGVHHHLAPLESLSPDDFNKMGFHVVVQMLEFALHAVPAKLKDEVYANIEKFTPFSNGILLFYGLCGNILRDVEKDFEDHKCRVAILKEPNGEIIDDCIGAVLGGRDAYLQTLKSFNGEGTFFLTPMWAANWRDMLVSSGFGKDPNDIETSRFVFETVGYVHVAKVETGLHYEKDFDAQVNEFAELFEFDIMNIPASLSTLKACYANVRDAVLEG
ncbi:hypothetical protein J2755_000695 [Methanohalophilus levihalophilus]|uniref:DUF1638 domain-containing protein n=1 Tax=Methanohalophilus levihalophilus TaxID=1431282 RepID=UPI001AE97116|nr:DUF1638 domain-containing protein [Methanohalophilus levihalophilus]MBP2029775.1 hypothetical protein [Methanohalophilus levihalophilus]